MKSMIILLRVALVFTLFAGFFNSDWSIMTNNWSASLFMFLLLMLGIEEGLRYYRVRAADIDEMLVHQREEANRRRLMDSTRTHQE